MRRVPPGGVLDRILCKESPPRVITPYSFYIPFLTEKFTRFECLLLTNGTPFTYLFTLGDVTRDDFSANYAALQHCCDIVSNGYNIVPTLQRCVALKIVVANCPV